MLQSIQLPFALVPVLTLASSRRVMGRFANGTATVVVTWSVALLVTVINLAAVYALLEGVLLEGPAWQGLLVTVAVLLYHAFLVYLVFSALSSEAGDHGSAWHVRRWCAECRQRLVDGLAGHKPGQSLLPPPPPGERGGIVDGRVSADRE